MEILVDEEYKHDVIGAMIVSGHTYMRQGSHFQGFATSQVTTTQADRIWVNAERTRERAWRIVLKYYTEILYMAEEVATTEPSEGELGMCTYFDQKLSKFNRYS